MRRTRRKLLLGSLAAGVTTAAEHYWPEHGFSTLSRAAPPRRVVVSTVPSWVSSLAIGQQYRIPNSSYWGPDVVAQYKVNHPDLSQSDKHEGHLHVSGRPGKLVDRMAFSGAGWNPDGCEFYLFGGGHSASFGNEVLRCRVNTERPAWEVIGQPSDVSAMSTCASGEHVPPLTWSASTFGNSYALDGKPKSPHMCTRNFYLPRDNSLWNFGGGTLMWQGQRTIDRFDCMRGEWSAPNSYGYAWSSMTPNLGNREYRDYAIVDYRDETVYLIKHASGRLYKWSGPSNPLTLTPMGTLSSGYQFQRVAFFVWPTCIDSQRNCMVIATAGHGSAQGPLKIIKVNLETHDITLHEVKWRVPEVLFSGGHALEYDSHGDRYLLFTGGDFFYTINARTLEVGMFKFTGDSLPATQRFWILNHLRYSPELKGTLLVSHGPKAKPTHEGCSIYYVKLHK